MIDALREVEGAYSLVALTTTRMIGVPRPAGHAPAGAGPARRRDGAVASETCALDVVGAEFVRDVEPGEIVVIDATGVRSLGRSARPRAASASSSTSTSPAPTAIVEGSSVYEVRKRIGAELAREVPVDADVVMPVPDSGVPAAIGYAQAVRHPVRARHHPQPLRRPHLHRADRQIRNLGVKLKHNANRALLEGKRVVLVDDFIVRGTTSTKIVRHGARRGRQEVHMRIACPPTTHCCFYGVDTPGAQPSCWRRALDRGDGEFIDVDSLAFISIDGLYRAIGKPGRDKARPQYCDACFTGDYPTRLSDIEGDLGGLQLSPPAQDA